MLERMKAMLREQDMCVLATCRDNVPHCSLMAYVADPDGRTVYMMTRRNTRKYENLVENRNVSLLVDTRAGEDRTARHTVQALTVIGTYHPVSDEAVRQRVRRELLQRHPQLADLAEQPDAELVSIKVAVLLLLDGVSQYFVQTIS